MDDGRPGKRLSPARSFAAGALPVLLLFAVTVPLLMVFLWSGAPRELVVVAFDARSGEPALDEALRAELISQLRGVQGVRILADIPLPSDGPDTRRAARRARRALCGATGADYVFSSEMSRNDSHYLVGVQVQSCSSGERLLAERVEIESREQLPRAVEWLASVARRLGS